MHGIGVITTGDSGDGTMTETQAIYFTPVVPDRMMYHCPRCGKWRKHTQQVFSAADGEHEYLTCCVCGNVLHFKRKVNK